MTYNGAMIPLRIHRALIVLFLVSAAIGLVEEGLGHYGIGRDVTKIISGLMTGFMVFVLAYEGGRVLRFCGKDLDEHFHRRFKFREARRGFVRKLLRLLLPLIRRIPSVGAAGRSRAIRFYRRVIRFGGKRLVPVPSRREKVRAALLAIGILEERRTGKRRREGIRNLELHGDRRQNGKPSKMLMYVSIVDSDRFIAITVNQGRTHRAFISSGMVDSMTPGALRGVLAHEYGHVVSMHPFKQATLLGLVASVKLSIGVPLGAVVVILLAYLFMLREWEYVADAAAVERTSKADVLDAFGQYQAIAGEKNMSVINEFFSGHPSFHRRVAAISRLAPVASD